MLVRGLPREALLRQPLGHPEAADWTVDSELLAQIADNLAVLATGRVYDVDPWRVPRPGWLEHSEQKAARSKASSPAEVAAFFGVVVG